MEKSSHAKDYCEKNNNLCYFDLQKPKLDINKETFISNETDSCLIPDEHNEGDGITNSLFNSTTL